MCSAGLQALPRAGDVEGQGAADAGGHSTLATVRAGREVDHPVRLAVHEAQASRPVRRPAQRRRNQEVRPVVFPATVARVR